MAPLERIEACASFFRPMTEQMFRQSGPWKGRSVLVVGPEWGELAALAARFVGARGKVVGIDYSDIANRPAADRDRHWPSSGVESDIGGVWRLSGAPFDAVLGRFLLMRQPDPVATIWRLASLVRVGGLLALQEFDLTQPAHMRPEVKLARDAARWVTLALRELGHHVGIGMQLHHSFIASGLERPGMIAGSSVMTGAEPDVSTLLAESVRDVYDIICDRGIATPDEIDIDTFAARLRQAVLETEAAVMSPLLVSAWTRIVRQPAGCLRFAGT